MTGRGSQTVQVRSVRGLDVPVSVREVPGAAPPLLMLNGIGAEHQLWGRTRDLLNRTTVTFDVTPPMLGRRPSMRTFAALVADVLEDLELGQVDVLGLSWGGMATQQAVHDHPYLFRRVVLVSTTPGLAALPPTPRAMRSMLLPRRDAAKIPQAIRDVYTGDFVDDPKLAARLGLIRRRDEATHRRQLVAAAGWSSLPWLASIRQPTLILHAEDDRVCPYVNATLVRGLIRRSELVRVPRGGHLFAFTRPEATARLVDEFLDRPDPA